LSLGTSGFGLSVFLIVRSLSSIEFGDGTDTAHGGNDTCGLVAEKAAGRFTSDSSLLCTAHSCGEAFRSQLCIVQMWQLIDSYQLRFVQAMSVAASTLHLWEHQKKIFKLVHFLILNFTTTTAPCGCCLKA
jgi:hypothetical protein